MAGLVRQGISRENIGLPGCLMGSMSASDLERTLQSAIMRKSVWSALVKAFGRAFYRSLWLFARARMSCSDARGRSMKSLSVISS